MKLHDLRPPEGSHKARTRVGRGIAAGKGKTAGRGTKGQKARAGGSIPPWFEGGQTPLHMRIPKLRGFKNRGKIQYEVVNVGDIAARADAGAFAAEGAAPPKKGEPQTINAEILRAVGLVRDVRRPLKILGAGELTTALFVVADAFTRSATAKIEAAGGSVSVLEVPAQAHPAVGLGEDRPSDEKTARVPRTAAGRAAASRTADARLAREADTAERAAEAEAASAAKAAAPTKARKSKDSPTPAETDEPLQAAEAERSPATAEAEQPSAKAEAEEPSDEAEVPVTEGSVGVSDEPDATADVEPAADSSGDAATADDENA